MILWKIAKGRNSSSIYEATCRSKPLYGVGKHMKPKNTKSPTRVSISMLRFPISEPGRSTFDLQSGINAGVANERAR